MTAAIYYHPEAYSTTGPKLMGRNAAGESFLRGFFAHVRTNEFWTLVQSNEHAKSFAQADHTTSNAMDSLANLLTVPVQPWDALIPR
jgi:hypothetical protein